MKHPLVPTIMLVVVFVVAQLIGLAIVSQYIDIEKSAITGTTVVINQTFESGGLSVPPVDIWGPGLIIYISFAIGIGTGLVLLIIKFKKKNLWKLWYFSAVSIGLYWALNPIILWFASEIGIGTLLLKKLLLFLLATLLAAWKIFKPNVYIHNLTEMLIYGGIAAILVIMIPNVLTMIGLLILISLYDAYAVWKSKHMVIMAKFQSSTNVFAGLSVPYTMPSFRRGKKSQKKTKKVAAKKSGRVATKSVRSETTSAILGGGDIAFPLLFSGVIMKMSGSFVPAIITTFTAAAALVYLLIKSEKGKFYPAMPFISAGCFVGYLITLLI